MPDSDDLLYSRPPTGDATRIARYLHLVVELPKAVVDTGNGYASSQLASYKREYLIDALAAFRKPLDPQLPHNRNRLLARLLRRALRRRHGHHAHLSPVDPRDDVNGMLVVLMAGVGLFLIDNFMRCPEVRSYMESQTDMWSEERSWLGDLSDHPDPLGRAMSTEYRRAPDASSGVVERWAGRGGWGTDDGDVGGGRDTDDGDGGGGDWGFD